MIFYILIIIFLIWLYNLFRIDCGDDYEQVGTDCLAKCAPNKVFGGYSCGRKKIDSPVKAFVSKKKCEDANKGKKCEGGGLIWKSCPPGYEVYLGRCLQKCPKNTTAQGEICKRHTRRKIEKDGKTPFRDTFYEFIHPRDEVL